MDFYHDREPAHACFKRFRDLAGNHYDLAAHMFFLKDHTRFTPIGPKTFDEAFRLLGVAAGTRLHKNSVLVALAGLVAEMIHSGERFHPGFVADWEADWKLVWEVAAPQFLLERKRRACLQQTAARLS